MSESKVVIAGGGVAGLETMLALADLAGDRADLTLVSAQPDFLYKPLMVEEPFGLGPAERHELAPLAEEKGARFVLGELSAVDPKGHAITLRDGTTIDYDYLVACTGGRYRAVFEHATTFPSPDPFSADEILDRAAEKNNRIAFVVPPGVTWSLPIYEIALMTERRARERGVDASLAIITPEATPLAVFGPVASDAVADLLKPRGIEFLGNSTVQELGANGIAVVPRNRRFGPAEVVALPAMEGIPIEGLPANERGFLPVDEHGRVKGLDEVYAAGDGTNFPVKQGGLASQQADAAAEHIAHRLGAAVSADPFHPVLRGKLLTGDQSLNLRTDVTGGSGEGISSAEYLWWPPHKISARYLAPLLYHGDVHEEPDPPVETLDVEVALPKEWHEDPM